MLGIIYSVKLFYRNERKYIFQKEEKLRKFIASIIDLQLMLKTYAGRRNDGRLEICIQI
jgi:hypothetical protein